MTCRVLLSCVIEWRRRLPAIVAVLLLLGVFRSAEAQSYRPPRPDPAHGRVLFERIWTEGENTDADDDGLGPLFNERSCVACHSQGGLGGGGPNSKNVDLLSVVVPRALQVQRGGGVVADAAGNILPTQKSPLADLARQARALHPELLQGTMILHSFGTYPSYAVLHDALLGLPTTAASGPPFAATNRWLQSIPVRMALAPQPTIRHGNVELQLSRRNSTALFGAGPIDLLFREQLLKVAADQGRPGSKITGRFVGRYGWRGQTDSLAAFVAGACSIELGLSVEGVPSPQAVAASVRRGAGLSNRLASDQVADISAKQFRDLVEFVDALPRPSRRAPCDDDEARAVARGEKLFALVGCAECHRPNIGHVEGLYSDLLVHDMGNALADIASPAQSFSTPPSSSVYYGTPMPFGERADDLAREWKTPPLWGVADSAPYLHDGRAATLDEAILWHGGEASDVVEAYRGLSPRSRHDVLVFLATLTAPARALQPTPAAAPSVWTRIVPDGGLNLGANPQY